MKKRTILLLTVLSLSSWLFSQEGNNRKSITTLFKKDKLIELAFLSVKPDKQKQLQELYFKQVLPIAKKYGLRPLAKVGVQYANSEYVQAQTIGFSEWESKEKHATFLKDPRFLKLKPIRDDAHKPQSFGIAFWKSKKSNSEFFQSEEYKKIKHDKDAAIKLIYGRAK